MSNFDEFMREETGAAEDVPPARDAETAVQEAQLAGLEEVEHAQVASGMYDADATTADVGALARKVLAKFSSLPKARMVLKQAAARRVALSAMSRVQHPNKMVPMSRMGMGPGTEEVFVYKSPDPAVFMGIILTPAVIANFGCTQFQLGSYRVLDGAQMGGGQGSSSVGSLAIFSPDARHLIKLGRNRILGGEALFTFGVRCIVPAPGQADFLATLLLYVRNSGC
ncbi:MAG TPA: hypothetical protein VLS89_14845 [Candidatus Nanopelagicales bacterium]|nr:hypothetical protein [Candidatus Nanopelagicales bacterium]